MPDSRNDDPIFTTNPPGTANNNIHSPQNNPPPTETSSPNSSPGWDTSQPPRPDPTTPNTPLTAPPTNAFSNTASTITRQTQFHLDATQKRFLQHYRTEVSAMAASLISTTLAYPLDSIKTRMQAYKFNSFLGCVRHTWHTEGTHGFTRGVFAPLASVTLVRTISFSIYQKAKYIYDGSITRATGKSPLVHANTAGAWPSMGTIACFGAAGATSGALITAISCPFELTKLNAQIAVLMEKGMDQGAQAKSQKPTNATGTVGTARMIMRHRGVFGLYSGFHLHLLRDTIGTAIYFMTYESSKQILGNARGASPTSPIAVALAGGLCGIVSWCCIYPIDSAKAIYQRNVLSYQPDASASAEGTAQQAPKPKEAKIEWMSRRRYRGLGVSMGRSCVVNMIFFSVFERMKKMVNGLEVEEGEE